MHISNCAAAYVAAKTSARPFFYNIIELVPEKEDRELMYEQFALDGADIWETLERTEL